jgi:hypothetical protein
MNFYVYAYFRAKDSKTYIVTSPFDESFVVKNLSKFCREEGLSQGLMSAVANKKRTHHKKWKCEHFIEVINYD